MIKISVIVPVYNTEKYLNKCLDSIINQTLKEIEIIIINDGSKDKSMNIIKDYQSKDSRIILIDQNNQGQAVARNNGIKKAKGEYLCFVDSDDYINLDMLEKLYEKAFKESLDIVVCNGQTIKEEETNIFIKNLIMTDDPIKNYIITNSGPCMKIIKKDLILKNKLYFLEIKYYEDIAVVPLYGVFTEKIGYLNQIFYNYIIHDNSTMNKLEYNKNFENIFIALEYLSSNMKEEYKEELEYIYIVHLLHAASLRFLKFKEGRKSLIRINEIMKNKYPSWRKNKYYKDFDIKYKIVCNLLYMQKYGLIKCMLKK